MSRRLFVALCAFVTHAAAAQSVAEYRARVDSLVKVWRPLAEMEAKAKPRMVADLPPYSVRAGVIVARADSSSAALARSAAERLDPMVTRAYGAAAQHLSQRPFVVVRASTRQVRDAVLTMVADSNGHLALSTSVFGNADAVYNSWARKAEQIMMDVFDPAIRNWIGSALSLDPPTRDDWANAHTSLLLAGSKATRECADGNVARCIQVLGLSESQNPAFEFYDAAERAALVRSYAPILRRADPALFDRCVRAGAASACDSVAELIPDDAIALPAPPAVRQNFIRFALQTGGVGAFDRFASAGSRRARVEAAARMPVDSVVARWEATISDTRSTSTALDVTTAVSSLMWAAACGALALRSSRWR